MTLYIRDDLGHAWYFDGTRIKMRLEDLAPELVTDNGYDCKSLEDGIRILNEEGYITSYDEPDYVDEEEQ